MNNNRRSRRKRICKADNSVNQNLSSAPELPGFYYDEAKQKYFKIGSNSFGITSAITTQSIASKQEENIIFKKYQESKLKNTNIINTLTLSQLNGISGQLNMDRTDYLYKTSEPQKFVDLSMYPKIRDMQAFKIDGSIYFLTNFSEDLVNYTSCVLRMNSIELEETNYNYQKVKKKIFINV